MRQKELEEDEKREQWHDDDQDGDPPSPPAPSLPAIFPPDLEQDSWQVVWESISHPSEVSSPSPTCSMLKLDNFVGAVWPHKPKADE